MQAYQRLGETDVPKFTVIVAQKRHHTKLFQAKGHENVPAGKRILLSSASVTLRFQIWFQNSFFIEKDTSVCQEP